MMFDVGIRFSPKSAAFYRIHQSMLSSFVIKVQTKGDFIFSVIPLFMKKESMYSRPERPKVFNGHYERGRDTIFPGNAFAGDDAVDTEAVDDCVHSNGHPVVDPIDHRSMVDSHGY